MKEVEEVVASTVIIPSKTRNGKFPKKVTSLFVILEAPLRNKKLRKLSEIEEE